MNTTVIHSDYEFGKWVYNRCPNKAEIRKQVLAHLKDECRSQFAIGVICAVELKHTKSGVESVFLKECEEARRSLL